MADYCITIHIASTPWPQLRQLLTLIISSAMQYSAAGSRLV